MIKTGRESEVRAELDGMPNERRAAITSKLAPRLWQIARIEGEMMLPAPQQTQAKDALFTIRKYADTTAKSQIDAYLVDWYATPAYEGRAKAGMAQGGGVMRVVGRLAAPKLMSVASGLIAAPGQDKVKKRIGDELLLGLAATGDPEAVKYVLDIARMDRGDETLGKRAMSALYTVYVDPGGRFDLLDPSALVPNLEAVAGILKSDQMTGEAANIALSLIQVIGPPQCLPPLLGMVGHPHPNPNFRYAAPFAAIKCGGVSAIKSVVEAMPDQDYGKEQLAGSVVFAISKLNPREGVLAELRGLLTAKSRVSRWVAVEALATMKSVDDAGRIAAVNGNERLLGFWGDATKSDPTLGQRARERAAELKAPK